MSRGDPDPGPVTVLGSSVVDRDGAAVSVTVVITRVAGGRLFANYMTSFERVWETAQSVTSRP